MSRARHWLALTGAALCLHAHAAMAQVQPAVADPLAAASGRFLSAGDWGGIGLLQTRTARFADEGQFEVGYSFVDPYKRYQFTNTFFPWLEATFRYTEIRNKLYSDVVEFSHDQRYKDRGADIKLRLLQERRFLPALALGFQDLLGTGLFAGEYVVASKQWGDFDFSVGMGWGSIGSGGGLSNPLSLGRRPGEVGAGGQLSVGDFFRGETVGIFGGVEYRTPFQGLSLKLEYDAHGYENDVLSHEATSPYNWGFVFRPQPWFEMSLGRERGNTTMLRFTLRSNLQGRGISKLDPPPPAITPRPSLASLQQPEEEGTGLLGRLGGMLGIGGGADRQSAGAIAADSIYDTLDAAGLAVDSFSVTNGEAVIVAARVRGASETLTATAVALLGTVPGDVVAVTLIERGGNGAELGRGRAARDARLVLGTSDPLTAALQTMGFSVERLDATGPAVSLRVASLENRPIDYASVARIASAFLPAAATVQVIDARSGQSETWLTGRSGLPSVAAVTQVNIAPPVPQVTEEQEKSVARHMQSALIAEGIVLESLELDGPDAFVSMSAFRYPQLARNEGLAARVIANNLPPHIETITMAFLNGGLEMTRTTLKRSDLERVARYAGSTDELLARASIGPGLPGYPGETVEGRYPRFSWSLSPQLRQHIGGPDRFYLWQAWLSASAGLDLFRGVSVTTTVGKNLYNNFKLLTLESDSLLPKVRSDVKHYLQEGADGNLVRLQTNFLAKPVHDVYFRLSAGLLEEMFGGISGEVLYRPFDSRFAIGAELSWVRQRDFDQRFRFRDYTVTTGHVSLYYDTPYKDVRLATHFGRYLAGDVGATFELSRRFESGVRIGAWATFTDVPPGTFGEGSFDKGFFIVIPFDVFTVRSTRATGIFAFRPLTRDGGQRLALSHRLFDMTSIGSKGELGRDWDRFLQ